MQKIFIRLFLISLTFLPIFNAIALTPPLPEKQLAEKVDLIVEGEVLSPITCTDYVKKTECYDQSKYRVPLKISKTIKGKASEGTIQVDFYYDDYSKWKCVGGQGPLLTTGDQGLYYLMKSKNGAYYPSHWSAVRVYKRGNGALPKCLEK